ncbi:hypothetical protein FA95DRAFT_951366 [Auriscalpium vulgare]|uniref:Uncharacterized protein n=1 Tax=Auriscalpium vulgare TaxID=40419 RepID=A0ACB8RZ37_9AGAM|nr:hypothetical protein FA95DRAFT_951366 [Auriscalpium vulgare]
MDFLKRAVFGTDSAFRDTQKLVVIGGTVETARRASVSSWNGFVDSFFLTAHFSQEDYPYDWLLHWLAKQPAWAPFDDCRRSNATEDKNDEDNLDRTEARRRKVTTHPPLGQTHTTYYRGHWLRITRTTASPNGSELKIGVVARNGKNILKELVLDAKRAYEMDVFERVDTFLGLKTTSKVTSSSQRFRDIQLHSTLSAWVENMRRLSGMIDAFQDISLAAPVNQQPGLTQKVAEMRADLRMQRERHDAFLQLTREYADRYLEDIKDEVHSQRALLDMLEHRLDAAKQLRTDVVEMQRSFAKGAREGFQEVKACARPCFPTTRSCSMK